MNFNKDDILNDILKTVTDMTHIESSEIPNIDLYMDQVTTFMEKGLRSSKRYEDDKILTKTMINNYAKNNLLPPPEKKKYSKEHQLLLILIYYFKNILSIRDIEKLLNPLCEKYFNTGAKFSLTNIYDEVWGLEPKRKEILKEDVKEIYTTINETFEDAPEEDRDLLQLFSFICSLAFDVYVKKQIIEKLIDSLPEPKGKDKK